MLALFVDFNRREVYPDGDQAAAIGFGNGENPPSLEQKMVSGLQVIIYDCGDSFEGVVRPGNHFPWVAVLVPGTTKELKPGEFERLEAETLRAAEETD